MQPIRRLVTFFGLLPVRLVRGTPKRYQVRSRRSPRSVCEAQRLLEIDRGEAGEHDERNHFLDRLELRGRIDGAADAVGRHGEAIFNEGDSPAHQHHRHERNRLELEMAISSNGHKQIRADEENDGSELGTESGRTGGRRHVDL